MNMICRLLIGPCQLAHSPTSGGTGASLTLTKLFEFRASFCSSRDVLFNLAVTTQAHPPLSSVNPLSESLSTEQSPSPGDSVLDCGG